MKMLSVGILTVSATLPVAAQKAINPPHATQTAHTESNQTRHVESAKASALSGNPGGQYSLASAYDSGYGVTQDYTKAAYWYDKAAQQGHLDALFSLAVLTEEGLGVKVDPTKALQAYRQGAMAGHAASQNNLGIALATWVNKQHRAKHWFTQAAQQGHAEAQYNLALILLRSRTDDATQQAKQWLHKAANAYPPAQQLLKTFRPLSATTRP